MLKNKTPKKMTAAIKLVTGEEIIALVTSVTESTITIKCPLTLVMTMPEAGSDQGQVAFAPWMLGLDSSSELTLQLTRVVYYGPARTDAAIEYHAATGFDEPESAVA